MNRSVFGLLESAQNGPGQGKMVAKTPSNAAWKVLVARAAVAVAFAVVPATADTVASRGANALTAFNAPYDPATMAVAAGATPAMLDVEIDFDLGEAEACGIPTDMNDPCLTGVAHASDTSVDQDRAI